MMPERAKILFLDDSVAQLQAVQEHLVAEGHDVAIAVDVNTALPLVSGRDLVIVDFNMPEMDGAQALPLLRAKVGKGQQTLFYLYTSDPAIAVRFRTYGFDGAFARKGTIADLAAQVSTVLKFASMRRTISKTKTGKW
jgi:CheY-like chemotaxis protein